MTDCFTATKRRADKAVFISYASQDAEAAGRLCEALRAGGMEVWLDQSALREGDAWDASIRRQIRECALFIALVSANTNSRNEGYFRLEWKLAVDRTHLMAEDQAFLLPVAIDDTHETTARVPDAFRLRQWTRLPGGEASAAFIERVNWLLGAGSAQSSIPEAPAGPGQAGTATRADDAFWIAVLPFRHRGTDTAAATLAEGLTEEIVTGLSRFSYLRVIARASTARYASEVADVRVVGRELGARYVIEGSVRQSGAKARIGAQLVDTVSGAHLWAESYERAFRPEEIFELQDEVAPRIVTTIADMNGVLPRTMSETLRRKPPDDLTPYEAVLRAFGYFDRVDAAEHALVRETLERTVRDAPAEADVWAMLSHIRAEEFKHSFNLRPGALQDALSAARRAVELAPTSSLGHHVLAQALFFLRDLPAFRAAAERAIALNLMDACTIAFMGILLAYSGDWERGCALTERAMQLNPNHPGWYRFAGWNNACRQRDYRGALDIALKFNMPSYLYTHFALAITHAQLGEDAAAQNALRELLAQQPDFARIAREELRKWHPDDEHVEHHLEGLRKAGLAIESHKPGAAR